jgi:hypothetical protein
MRNTVPTAYTAVPTVVTTGNGHVRRNQRSRWTGILTALIGNYQPGHLFSLRQSLYLHDFYQTQVSDCDRQIGQVLAGPGIERWETEDTREVSRTARTAEESGVRNGIVATCAAGPQALGALARDHELLILVRTV